MEIIYRAAIILVASFRPRPLILARREGRYRAETPYPRTRIRMHVNPLDALPGNSCGPIDHQSKHPSDYRTRKCDSSSKAGGGQRARAAQGRLWQPHPVFRWVSIPYHSTVSRTFISLFKVLCIFRSLYLFAIGLVPVFSLMRGIPHN